MQTLSTIVALLFIFWTWMNVLYMVILHKWPKLWTWFPISGLAVALFILEWMQ